MSHARRFHEPGVGARTGMRIEEGMTNLDDFLNAARLAMNGGTSKRTATGAVTDPSDSGEDSGEDSEGRHETAIENIKPGSSSMMIVQSPGPSPRSTIRRSQAPSSSPFLSSPGTARNASVSPAPLFRPLSPTYEERARFSSERESTQSISSPSKARGLYRPTISVGLEARRKKRKLDEQAADRVSPLHQSLNLPENTSDHSGQSDHDSGDERGRERSCAGHDEAGEGAPESDARMDRLSTGAQEYEDSIAMQQFPVESSEGLEATINDGAARTKNPREVMPVKALKIKKKSRVLKEKNGSAVHSLASSTNREKPRKRVDDDGDDEGRDEVKAMRQKAPRVEERRRAGSAQREIVERIPSSHHRQISAEIVDENGVRRGSRYRYKPLEYWRGEKARFGRPSLPKSHQLEEEGLGDETIDGDAFEDHFAGVIPPVAVLKEIIRIPREEGEGTFSGMKMKKDKTGDRDRVKSTLSVKEPKAVAAEGRLDPTLVTRHAEEGWDAETEMEATVWDAETKAETTFKVACTSAQVRPRLAVKSTFAFEKVFVVDHTMATGVLSILVEGHKPLKNAKENNYTFVVLEGAVRVQLHKTEFVIAPHGMFFVPRGNDYSIANISRRTAKVAFTQCRGS
ncbi:hypothetical protein CBS101457_005860 [Exobasidium rhododendri]|nr:hypothetical protein CBS101457_005860 [Exobasidium rhododendri]